MTIGVCDEEAVGSSHVFELLEKYREEHMLSYRILEFTSGDELLNCSEDIYLIFLDFDIQRRDGMDTVTIFRKRSPDTMIIFVTSYLEMMPKAFEVKALRCYLKPLKAMDFEKCMKAALSELEQSKVIFNDNGTLKIINLSEIFYIEAGDNCTFARTEQTLYRSKYTMVEWQDKARDERFFRCHKTYIVNMKFINEVHTDEIVLNNSEKVLLSRRSKKEFQQKLLQYIKNNSR